MEIRSSELRKIGWVLVVKLVALPIAWLLRFSSPPAIQSETILLNQSATSR